MDFLSGGENSLTIFRSYIQPAEKRFWFYCRGRQSLNAQNFSKEHAINFLTGSQ